MKKSIINPTLMLIAMIVLTACVQSNQQNNQQEKRQTTPKKVKLQYEYNMFCPSDILEFADIEITYSDGSGNLVNDTISSGQQEGSGSNSESTVDWHTNIKINEVPTRLYLSFRYLPKADVSAGTDKSVSTAATMYFASVNADQIMNFHQSFENPDQSVKASELKAYFDKFNQNPPALDFTLQEMSGLLNKLGLVKND